jgi:hypothetical protein
MNCPNCGAPMVLHEGEDEKSGDVLAPFFEWRCHGCGHSIYDHEEGFEEPDENAEPIRRLSVLQVQRVRCATCIYRGDSVLNLKALEDEVRDPHMGFRSYRACHHSQADDVVCRGFWDHHRDEFQLGQIAQRLGLVLFVDVDDLSEFGRKP